VIVYPSNLIAAIILIAFGIYFLATD